MAADIDVLHALIKHAEDQSAERKVLEIKMRVFRRIGQLINQLPRKRARYYKSADGTVLHGDPDNTPTRKDLGLGGSKTRAYQVIAKIDDVTFDAVLASVKFPCFAQVYSAVKDIRNNKGSREMAITVGNAPLSVPGGALTETSWTPPDNLTESEWLEVGKTLGRAERSIAWWIGDWWNYGEHKYGDRKAIVESEDWSGPDFKTCANAGSICRMFESSRRREVLSFKHHAEVAFIEPNEADEVLDWAEATVKTIGKPRSTRELRAKVKSIKTAASEEPRFSAIIKPSDLWNFGNPLYGRIDEGSSHGFIAGEIYANCFFRYVNEGDKACDIMAGSGQAQRVYEDRAVWGRGRKEPVEFELRMFDRQPRGPYASQVEYLDATKGLPDGYRPDYIFADVPYFKMVKDAYSSDEDDIANMDWSEWEDAMQSVANSCAEAQDVGGLCTIVSPNAVVWNKQPPKAKGDTGGPRRTPTGQRVMVCEFIREWWRDAGYLLIDVAYSPRIIQQEANAAFNNFNAKAARLSLSEVSEVMTFMRGGQ
jgi:hypothetical protein